MMILIRKPSLHGLVLLLILLVTGAAVRAQAPAKTDASPPEQEQPVTAEQLKSLRTDLRAGEQTLAPLTKAIDTAGAEAWLKASPVDTLTKRAAAEGISDAERALWQDALKQEQAAAELLRGALRGATLALGGKDRLEDALHQVDAMLAPLAPSRESKSRNKTDSAERTVSRIEQDIASLNNRRAQAALELKQNRETLANLQDQARSEAETLDQLRRERPKAAPSADKQDPALAEARKAQNEALARATQARVLAAQLDSQTIPPRIDALQLEVRENDIEVRWLDQQLAASQAELGQKSTEELTGLATALQELVEREPDLQQSYADEIKAMREQIDRIGRSQSRIRQWQIERDDDMRMEADLTQTLADVNERLQVGGLSQTLGSVFLEEQRRLRALGDKRNTLSEVERSLAQSRLREITLREQLREAEPDSAVVDTTPEGELASLQYKITTASVRSEESLSNELRQTEVPLRAVVGLIDQLDRSLRETLLWWPSHRPVSLRWAMTRVPAAVLALLDPASWQGIRSAFLDVTLGSPASTLLILLVVGALYAAGRPAGRHLRSLAEKTQHRFTDNIGLTFRAMGWSLLRVLPAPVLLMAIALRLRQIPETAPGVEIIASAAFNGAIWWLAGHLVALFISRNGVGTVHFGWNPCMVRRLRRNLAWYLPIQFILIVGLALAFGHPSDLVFDVLGRAALVASGVMTGALAWRLLAPNADLHRALSGSVRRLVRIAAISYAAGLVILALAGYLLTVSTLFERTIYTAVVVVGVWLGYRLAMRALILSEMRLRVRRMLEQRAKAAAADGGDAATDGAAEVPEPALSIEDINLQTRALVKVVAGGIMVLALFGVWANVLPALAWLDSVTLWTRSVKVGATEVVSQVSLQDALLALFLIVLSGIAARNLPGLVEIILTRSTRMDAAGRYTVTTLLRYLIMIAAVISVFSLLGLRWSQLQWMVAALTLGLGFGLQEVVANFVSGLIMLFERPARVGDLVTIGEYTGTVAKIRTRATTIIDGDNREVLVPNKMFITERLINWTLSDTMTRIVVPIGVSYDTDVDLVKATLQQIAEQNPLLMKDPAPSVFFTKISASTFDFELRGYVKLLRDRLEAMSTLQAAIVNEFRRLGIDMAFPQMDLHIRDLPAAQSVVPAKAPAAKTAS